MAAVIVIVGGGGGGGGGGVWIGKVTAVPSTIEDHYPRHHDSPLPTPTTTIFRY